MKQDKSKQLLPKKGFLWPLSCFVCFPKPKELISNFEGCRNQSCLLIIGLFKQLNTFFIRSIFIKALHACRRSKSFYYYLKQNHYKRIFSFQMNRFPTTINYISYILLCIVKRVFSIIHEICSMIFLFIEEKKGFWDKLSSMYHFKITLYPIPLLYSYCYC